MGSTEAEGLAAWEIRVGFLEEVHLSWVLKDEEEFAR